MPQADSLVLEAYEVGVMPDYRRIVTHRDGSVERYRLRCDSVEGHSVEGWELKAAMIPHAIGGDVAQFVIEEGVENGLPSVASEVYMDTMDRDGMVGRPTAMERGALMAKIAEQRAKHSL